MGGNAKLYPDLVKQIQQEGHAIASHTWTHPMLTRVSHQELIKQIQKTDDILVQITAVKEINGDDKGRVKIVTVGSGEAIILKKGAVIYGIWKKKSLGDRTRFYDKNKKEIFLAPGNTWVEVVPKETNILVMN